MKQLFHLLFILLFSFQSNLYAQSQNKDSLAVSQIDTTKSDYIIEFDTDEQSIKVTKVKSGKETLIDSTKNKRIKVYTHDKKLYQGKWKIIDEKTIRIKKRIVQLSTIKNIKKQRIPGLAKAGISVGVIGGLMYLGAVNINPVGYMPPFL